MNLFIVPTTLQFNVEVHARPLVDVEMYCMMVTTSMTKTEIEMFFLFVLFLFLMLLSGMHLR